jgi:hypothetical protein
MADEDDQIVTFDPNASVPLTAADIAAICILCETQVELWHFVEPYVLARLWDVDDILLIWNHVRASMAYITSRAQLEAMAQEAMNSREAARAAEEEESQRPQETQVADEQKTRPKWKFRKAWAKVRKIFREFLGKHHRQKL